MIKLVEINYNTNWPYIPDHPHGTLIIDGSGSAKNKVLLNLLKHQQPDIDKIYLHVKDPFESKYQLLINGREKVGIGLLKNPKASLIINKQFIDVYENLEDYDPTKKRKVLIVFDSMIADMESNKKIDPIVTEVFLRRRKLNISLIFISLSYMKVPKTIRLNGRHYFIMKISSKRELQ